MSQTSFRLRDTLRRAGLTPFQPPISIDEARTRAEELTAKLSPEEQFSLVVGGGFVIQANERVGLPEITMFDATQGVHLRDSVSAGHLRKSVGFPSMLSLAASWNRTLVARYARSIGEECRAGGIHVLLGPGVNIYRIAQNGRNFEYAGEDPFLAADVARIYVTALQQTGTMATVKHFIANNTDWCRRLSNSVVGRRALEEIYLPAFEAAVEAGTMAVMTAYNQLNGEYCGESSTVINELLRSELGFDRLVMTDWTSVTDGELVAASGQDLEMPSGEALRGKRDMLVGDSRVTSMATRVLTACTAMGFLDEGRHELPEFLEELPAHEELAYRVAAEGIVLLKNESELLPFSETDGRNVLVTGNWGTRTPLAGSGSGYVAGYNQISFLEAVNSIALGADVRYRAEPSHEELEQADLVLVATGFEAEGEGADRPFALPEDQNELIERAGAANGNTVVALVTGGGVSMPWHDSAGAILHTFFGGQQGAPAAAGIVFGHINPSGKLPFTIETDFADSPGAGYIPEGGHPEDRQPGEEHPLKPGPEHVDTEWPYDVHYTEEVFVGYRWYADRRKPVRYWFGHGLSYTTFTYDSLEVEKATGSSEGATQLDRPLVTVRFTIGNAGRRPGAEIAQLYVAPPSAGTSGNAAKQRARRPARELKGYEKVFLEPGEQRSVTLYLTARDFAYYDMHDEAWRIDEGTHEILVGASYADIRQAGSTSLEAQTCTK